MKKALIIVVALATLAGISFVIYKFRPKVKNNEGTKVQGSQIVYNQVKVGSQEIKVEVMDNEESRMKGLSGRDGLADNEGMLFVFEKSDIYPFWMKDMKFAIDIIWINNKKIVEIIKSAPAPESSGQIASFTPKEAADIVLEVNAGFCDKNNVKIGDEIDIN